MSRAPPVGSIDMDTFDYNAAAELFPSRSRASRLQYKRFVRAADAIQFAIEELPPAALRGAWLEVGEERFDAQEICRLYEHPDYPLRRRKPPAAPKSIRSSRSKAVSGSG